MWRGLAAGFVTERSKRGRGTCLLTRLLSSSSYSGGERSDHLSVPRPGGRQFRDHKGRDWPEPPLPHLFNRLDFRRGNRPASSAPVGARGLPTPSRLAERGRLLSLRGGR